MPRQFRQFCLVPCLLALTAQTSAGRRWRSESHIKLQRFAGVSEVLSPRGGFSVSLDVVPDPNGPIFTCGLYLLVSFTTEKSKFLEIIADQAK